MYDLYQIMVYATCAFCRVPLEQTITTVLSAMQTTIIETVGMILGLVKPGGQ